MKAVDLSPGPTQTALTDSESRWARRARELLTERATDYFDNPLRAYERAGQMDLMVAELLATVDRLAATQKTRGQA
ncbi:MAG: hypothetical protein GEU94_11640 [Micromonosporaceae bacterium]|nr:hypothetical protein [Micromonosporaceae bacterium]